MIIGYILGIPITIWAVYYIIVKPLFALGERQDPESVGGKIFTVITVIVLLFLILGAAVVGLGIYFALSLA